MSTAVAERNELKIVCAEVQEPVIFDDTRTMDDNTLKVGNTIRQGDVYVTRIASLPKFVIDNPQCKTPVRQLAEGATQGSRHVLEGDADVYRPEDYNRIVNGSGGSRSVGLVFEAKEKVTITHPEHANFVLPPGCYEVSHQVDGATGRRVAD